MIGVIMRSSISEANHKIEYIYDDIYKAIIKFGKIPIAIYSSDYKTAIEQIKLCESVILSGGDDFTFDDLKITSYLYDSDIPTLGICLGMQTMACLLNGKMGTVENHKSPKNYSHTVLIDHNSIIYKIINKDKIVVNSRHKDCVKCTNLSITGVSEDNTIEIVEDFNKTFFVGLQWHPENMIEYDLIERDILSYFIKGEYNESN